MKHKPISNNSMRAKIYAFYKAGFSARMIHNQTGWDYNYIDQLCFDWSVLEAKEKAKDGAVVYCDTPTKAIRNVGETDFALLTNNQFVIEAYHRMINPKIDLLIS